MVVIDYASSWDDYCRGCRMAGGGSNFDVVKFDTDEGVARYIADRLHARDCDQPQLFLVCRDFRDLLGMAFNLPSPASPGHKWETDECVHVQRWWTDYDAEDWDEQKAAEEAGHPMEARLRERVRQLLADKRAAVDAEAAAKKAAETARAAAAQDERDRAEFARLKLKFPEG